MLECFIQLYDNDMVNETIEGEGLIVNYSELFGFEVNFTGYKGDNALDIAIKYQGILMSN